jgi:hypothetical protein
MIFRKDKRTFRALIALSVCVCLLLLVGLTPGAGAATTSVTATVGTTLTCTTDNSSTAFGTLSSGSITTAASNVTASLSCNSGGGCTLFVKDAGNASSPGLYAAAATSSPIILSATAALSAGTEGYGIQAATSSNGTGNTLTLSPIYLKTGNNVGGLSLTDVQLASTTSPVASREVVVTHKAAISGLTKAGSYADTITYSCTGN